MSKGVKHLFMLWGKVFFLFMMKIQKISNPLKN